MKKILTFFVVALLVIGCIEPPLKEANTLAKQLPECSEVREKGKQPPCIVRRGDSNSPQKALVISKNATPTHIEMNRINNKVYYDWIFLYWMPYDNNLSRFGTPIIEMITKGVQTQDILVVIESDFIGTKQLSRHIITKDKVDIQTLDAVNSASENNFAEYLNWAHSQFEAQKWAIVFLGHGGYLDEVSPDEYSGNNRVITQWMNIHKLSNVVVNFNRQINDRIELFFFQNCNKGTIEAHYTVRNVAKYTLSSQKILGAPNYYYESLFEFLGKHPKVNGKQVAEQIRKFERSDMYHSYTVTDNDHFSKISETINPLIDLVVSSKKTINLTQMQKYGYSGEQYVDVIDFFKNVTEQTGAEQEKYNIFVEFINNSVIHLPNPNVPNSLSGLGIFLPSSMEQLEKYSYLQIYSDLKLLKLFHTILLD